MKLSAGQSQHIRDVQAGILDAIKADTSIAGINSTTGRFNRDFAQIALGTAYVAGEAFTIVGYVDRDADQALGADSSGERIVLGQVYEVSYLLADPLDETPYTVYSATEVSQLDQDLAVLLDRHWWEQVSGVVGSSIPERSEIQRTGNVIHYQIQVQLTLEIGGL